MANIVRKGSTGSVAPSGWERWEPLRVMRDLLHWDPFGEMMPFAGREAERAMTFMPSFEVKETKDSYVFKADLPGVKEEDLDIALAGNRLTISGEREAETKESNETYYAYECGYGRFSRSFTLPEGVDSEHVAAELKSGVLTLTLPKRAELQAKKISLHGEKTKAKA